MENAAVAKIATLIFVFSKLYRFVDICSRTNEKNHLNFAKIYYRDMLE